MPSALTTYGEFRERYPEGAVLQPVRGAEHPGGPTAAYEADAYATYLKRDAFGLYGMRGQGDPPQWTREDLAPKDVSLGIEHGGAAVGYPRARVAAAGGLVTDTVGGASIVVVLVNESLHAFEAPGFALTVVAGDLRGDGTTFDPLTGESVDGRRLSRVPAVRLYAFAWQAAHGPTSFWAP